METKIQETAKKLLQDAEVDLVVGYGKDPGSGSEPVFIYDPEDAGKLIWDKDCYNNLAVYLTKDPVKKAKKVGIVAKGCDVKAIVGLIQENQIEKEKVVIIGLACDGVGDPVLKKCEHCDVKTPGYYDHLIGEAVEAEPAGEKYGDVKEFERKTDEEKKLFWDKEMEKCIKCYACRAVCPMCYCSRCIAEKNQPQWVAPSPHGRGNFSWNFMRAFHLAGRCAGCGECERVCPAGIPLNLINKKTALETKRHFGYEAGYDLEADPPLTCFEKEDDEGFIR